MSWFRALDSQTLQVISAAVVAAATLAILIATVFYVWYTRRLWQETRRAAEQSAEQVRLIGSQVDLVTREMSLRIRPYVSPRLEPKMASMESMEFRFHLSNTGPVPAHISKVIVEAWLNNDPIPTSVIFSGGVIFPGETLQTAWNSVNSKDMVRGRARLQVKIRVEYSGPWEGQPYVSEFIVLWREESQMFVNQSATVT